MAEVKITDLVPKETIDELVNLRTEMGEVVTKYKTTALELAKGLQIKVEVIGDLDKLNDLYVAKSKEITESMKKMSDMQQRYTQIVGQTTPVLSRQLMEVDKANRATQVQYDSFEKAGDILDRYKKIMNDNAEKIVKVTDAMAKIKARMDENKKAYKDGTISVEEYTKKQTELMLKHEGYKQAKSKLNQELTAEIKLNQAGTESYNQLSQQLELMKKAYKDMSRETREGIGGQELLTQINELDSHLKDLAGNMGEFQRNVGNYAIAGQNGVVATESLNAALAQQAVTVQDVADQTKILEEAKRMLDTNDKEYPKTLEAINAKLAENKARLADVSDIMDKQPATVREAEEQNKRFAEALKLVDLNSEGAKERIQTLNTRIEQNKKLIEENTKALQDNTKESKALADQVLSLVGINNNFGSSLTSLEVKGNVFDGLKTKVNAFGKTLTGLLANPWVLTFLGIAGVAAGAKWWYEYNKGLIEATKLTKNFTGENGAAMQHLRSEIQALADYSGKGFDETIKTANTFVQQFGMKWEEAIGLMKDGFSAGADMSGNFLSNIERFAPAMRDAGVSADEFVAILANTKNGIFDEKGVDDILKGGIKLRAMNKQIASSLDAVGISSEKMKKDLAEGNITMLEGLQKVANKLKELPDNSQEAGEIMKNVFGRTAAQGGKLLIESIADVNTSLEDMKESMGEWGKLQIEQMEAQAELNETVAKVFDLGEKGFESWIAKGKIYATQTLTNIIKKGVDVYNWIVDVYNETVALRGIIGGIIFFFKALYDIGKGLFNLMIEGFRGTAVAVKGLLQIMSGDFEKGWNTISQNAEKHFKKLGKIISDTGKEIGKDFTDGINDALNNKLDKIDLSDLTSDAGATTNQGRVGIIPGKNKELTENEKKALEKAAQEQLKILQQLDESKIALIQNTHEKEMATIKLNFRKKLEAIKGEGENETALRIQLLEQMNAELEQCEKKYQEELAKTNLANKLASVKKGSKEELDIRLAQLEQQKAKEIEEAEKSGADILLIEQKYNAQRLKLQEDYAKNRAQKIMDEYSGDEATRNQMMQSELIAVKQTYAERLKEAGNDAKKREQIEKDYQRRVADIQTNYAKASAQAAIETLEKILEAENLSAEERERYERELLNAKLALWDEEVEANKRKNEEEQQDDEDSTNRKLGNVQKWLQVASQAISAISELTNALFDGQISKIEEQQQANEEAGEKEIERINELVEKQVITEEEGEARKRAAEAKTAKENEKLEKKKAELQYKQAVFQKAVDLAQAAISTALALIQLWVSPGFPAAIPMAAVVGSLGAIQMATIAATPIPKYKDGTPWHGGGPAIVGDGGKPEVIMIGQKTYLTPDTPTLVDLPRGAAVYPDLTRFAIPQDHNHSPLKSQPVVNISNDYKALERKMGDVADLLRLQNKLHRRNAYLQQYEIFKATRL